MAASDGKTWCLCGRDANLGRIGGVPVRVCESGEHVIVGHNPGRAFVYVENPADVIERFGLVRPQVGYPPRSEP